MRSLAIAMVCAGCANEPAAPVAQAPQLAPPLAMEQAPPAPVTPLPAAFHGASRDLDGADRDAMQGTTMHPGCPVGLDELVKLELSHWGMDGEVHQGALIVAREQAQPLIGVFSALFDARYPIQSMRPMHHFGGSDKASMAANNTSAFNCRRPKGQSRYSDHSYGHALDLNPQLNPWVRRRGDEVKVDPPSGIAYVDRDQEVPGLIVGTDSTVQSFAAIGWRWGGSWRSVQDYQHFSLTGT